MRNLIRTVALSSIACIAADAFATECTGNACSDVFFGWENDCYTTENLSNRRIRVLRGPYEFLLQAKERHVLRVNNQCVDSYFGGNQAFYADGKGNANGQQCSEGKVSPWTKDEQLKLQQDAQCTSGYCYPGPTLGNVREVEWYCLRADLNCAWPGAAGYRYEQWKSWAGGSNNVKCRNPGNNNRARFSD